MSIQAGDRASRTATITSEMIAHFADATGDHNPVHLDEVYATQTQYGKRIAHGIFTAGLISAVLANDLPGPGTVYLTQDLRFKAPVFIGDTITTTVEVTKYHASRRIAVLQTTCTNQNDETVLEGEAKVIAPE